MSSLQIFDCGSPPWDIRGEYSIDTIELYCRRHTINVTQDSKDRNKYECRSLSSKLFKNDNELLLYFMKIDTEYQRLKAAAQSLKPMQNNNNNTKEVDEEYDENDDDRDCFSAARYMKPEWTRVDISMTLLDLYNDNNCNGGNIFQGHIIQGVPGIVCPQLNNAKKL